MDLPEQIERPLQQLLHQAALLPPEQRAKVLDVAGTRVQAAQTDALADLAADGALTGTGCKTVVSWARLHLRRGATGWRQVNRARRLPAFPGFAKAFAAGTITDEHLDVLLRWATTLDAADLHTHEPTLLQLAQTAGPAELDQALQLLAELTKPDRDADKIRALANRRCTIRTVGDLVHVDAMVEPEIGEALTTAIAALTDRTGHPHTTATNPPHGHPTDQAADQAADQPTGQAPDADPRTAAQRRADAFAEIVLTGLGALQQQNPKTGRLVPAIRLTVPADYLLHPHHPDRPEHPDRPGRPGVPHRGTGRPRFDHHGHPPRATVHRLLCDSWLARILTDPTTGAPVDVGRRHRLATPAQRDALATTYRHCVFPGCTTAFARCDLHHLTPWSQGGATDLHQLLPYCWTHHHFLHEHGFTATRTHDGTLLHHRPNGTPIADPAHATHHALTQLRLDIRGPHHDPDHDTDDQAHPADPDQADQAHRGDNRAPP